MTAHRPRFSARRRSVLKGLGALGLGLTFLPRNSLSAEEKKLNFYNWDTYIGETTLADFEKATGIEVKMDLFADNDELFAKLKAGNPGYDVICPTNDNLERMIKANMVIPLDHSKLPNFSNMDPIFQDAAFDPGRKHSITYLWGTVGVGYRKSKVEGTVDSWKVLFEEPKYAGRIALLGDAKLVIGSALKYLGHSLNTTDPAILQKVEELLIAGKKNVKVYADDNGQDLLAAGDVDLTMEYNGDILQVMQEDDDITFAVPTEGAEMWQDCLAIPTGAPRPENAHAFLNFIMDPQVEAALAGFVQYGTPNAAAKKLMDKSYTENPAIFPPAEVIAKCEPALYLGEDATKLRSDIWTRVQAA
ncbi:spermidine/putrescine ABC transporter substrate-binding protein [Nordella sp. HKS 07]|uniref:ABC transporter substrate-binding protein n=1 Tax=Nordella sp. HKS 07 TaxID=2712222 RepID=UPI0013E186F2|nr:spermidine/putrescine ABC transporter substrate-binding protein [Nordella sp. HKS 07]QIG50188.1 spermidine/putrescine ABC transporter substrate-binding protein [Nordella sp. HKS 07]